MSSSVGMMKFPDMKWKNKIHVPNHQPDIYIYIDRYILWKKKMFETTNQYWLLVTLVTLLPHQLRPTWAWRNSHLGHRLCDIAGLLAMLAVGGEKDDPVIGNIGDLY